MAQKEPKAEDGIAFFTDIHFPARLVTIIRELGFKRIHPHSEHFARDADDAFWIPAIAAKQWVIISNDRDIITGEENPFEYETFRKCQAKAIFLGPHFDHLKRFDWAIWIFKNWERLVQKAESMKPGEVAIAHKDGRIVTVDPEKYRVRMKAQRQRNARKYSGKHQGPGKGARKAEKKRRAATPGQRPLL
jgi:hypothetical protein